MNTYTLVRHEGDIFASSNLDAALDLCNPDPGTESPVEWGRCQATDACAARLWPTVKVWREVSPNTLKRYWAQWED